MGIVNTPPPYLMAQSEKVVTKIPLNIEDGELRLKKREESP